MKGRPAFSVAALCIPAICFNSGAAIAHASRVIPLASSHQNLEAQLSLSKLDESTFKDGLHSLELGLQWLSDQQHPDGSWSLPQYPAMTALAVSCFCMDPRRSASDTLPELARNGLDFILSCVQPDGGIYVPTDKGPALPHYNTALTLTALVLTNDMKYRGTIEAARRFLVGSQHMEPDVFRGGFGYDASLNHNYADLSSTYMVLESIWAAEKSAPPETQKTLQGDVRLNWDAALQFLTRVQNLPSSNDQPWAQTPTAADLGGFVYYPGESKAGDETSEDGSRRFHSYGSMSYAGLLSLLYADVTRDDPRVTAAVDWIRRHYTVDENPGMGAQGLYYSYHTMAKALTRWGEEPLVLPDGRRASWRKDLTQKLVSLQRIDAETSLGYWVNDNGRWWENDPVLATSYALMALEMVLAPPAGPIR